MKLYVRRQCRPPPILVKRGELLTGFWYSAAKSITAQRDADRQILMRNPRYSIPAQLVLAGRGRTNQRYRCLVVDLPEHGKSFQQGPFGMGRATTAVAELSWPRVRTGRSHENDMPNCQVPSAVSSSPAEVSG
jgi:hypothetical protein